MHMDVLIDNATAEPKQDPGTAGKRARGRGQSSAQQTRKKAAPSKRLEKAILQVAGRAAVAQAAGAGAAVIVLDDDVDDNDDFA